MSNDKHTLTLQVYARRQVPTDSEAQLQQSLRARAAPRAVAPGTDRRRG